MTSWCCIWLANIYLIIYFFPPYQVCNIYPNLYEAQNLKTPTNKLLPQESTLISSSLFRHALFLPSLSPPPKNWNVSFLSLLLTSPRGNGPDTLTSWQDMLDWGHTSFQTSKTAHMCYQHLFYLCIYVNIFNAFKT